MTSRATPNVTRRVTRASSLAGSEDSALLTSPSDAQGRRARSTRATRSAVPLMSNIKAVPRITNKQSRAYGAEGKPDYAHQLTATTALERAFNPIESAVNVAEASSLQKHPSPIILPTVEEESRERRPHGAGTKVVDANSPSDAIGFDVHEDTDDQSPWPGRSGWFDLSTWAPRDRSRNKHVQETPQRSSTDRPDQDFWAAWETADGQIGISPAAAKRRWWKIVTPSYSTPFYATLLSILLLSLILLDIYRGPLLGPEHDYLTSRTGSTNLSDPSSWQHTIDLLNARFSRIETMVTALTNKPGLLKSTSVPVSPTPSLPQINWFAAGLGAAIDPYLSSPTDSTCLSGTETSWWTQLKTSLVERKRSTCNTQSDPPVRALCPWTEADERWCAPASHGKLQLTVMTPRLVGPKELVMEHIPKSAALAVGSAPREIELWVDLPDHFLFDQVLRLLNSEYAELLRPPQNREAESSKRELPNTFLPLGRWIYDIYADEHIQSFSIPAPLLKLGIRASRFAIRVNSNWNSLSPTCLYRVRLHGEDMSGDSNPIDPNPND